jgi:hypothetical protein
VEKKPKANVAAPIAVAGGGHAEIAVERKPKANVAAPVAVAGGGHAEIAVKKKPKAKVAAPVVVSGPRAAATIQASQSDVLNRMIDLALSSGCMSFSASVGSGHATFTKKGR